MTISILELEQQLKTQFNVKVICDLGDLSTGANNLFKLLDSCYQDKYENNDRFIFYTSHIPSEQFFRHLYETANFIDISNWFITICGPEELHPIILSSCEKYSLDPVPFQFLSVDIADTHQIQNNFSLPDTLCAVPWTNIEIRQNGDITPCCLSSSNLGNINDITIEQAFRGHKLQKLRNSLLSGERPVECNSCWKVEEKNLSSIRMYNIKRLKKDFLTKYLDQPQIATLDIKFNNTCNFKCRICDSVSSSLFAQEQHKFLGRPLVAQSNWSESPEFIDQMIDHLPHIHNIDMFGGEPFLIKKFSEVLRLAVERDHAKNIRLHYNSNGSVWPEHFLSHWAHFKLVDIHFSIDAVGEQFELQRGGRWQEVEDNILRLKGLGLPNLSISVMPTISTMNVYYIDQVYDWALSHGFPIFVSHARGIGIELKDLTKKAKEIIIKKFKNHPWNELQSIIKVIQEIPDSDGCEFQNKVEWFDRVRKENFSDSHSEIASAMGYVYNRNSAQ